MGMKMRRVSIAKAIGIIIIAGILVFGALVYKLLFGGIPEVHNSSRQYGNWENFAGYSGLKIFPRDISKESIREYYYRSQDTIFSPEAQVFLEAVFEKDAFEQEVERLSHICMSDGKETNLVLEDNRHFPADAYICEYNWNHCYEYALVFPEALKINYIFLQNIDAADAAFEDSLLPEGYGEESEENPYCLYAFGTGKNVIWYE